MLFGIALCVLVWSAPQATARHWNDWYTSAIQPSPSLQASYDGKFLFNFRCEGKLVFQFLVRIGPAFSSYVGRVLLNFVTAHKLCYFSSTELACLNVYSSFRSVYQMSIPLVLYFVLKPRYWGLFLCVIIPAIVRNICLAIINSVV